MSQIALPFRIALVALLVFAAAWFTVLKPKSDSGAPATPPQAPGVKGLATDVAKAKKASAESDATNAAIQAGTGGASTAAKPAATAAATSATHSAAKPRTTTKAPATKPEPATNADPSAPLLRTLGKHGAVVLLFYSRHGSDDRFVRSQVRAVGRHHGKVVVKAAPIRSVGRYEAITQGVTVGESPTVLVIGPKKTAVPIVGYTTTAEIDQAVADALRG